MEQKIKKECCGENCCTSKNKCGCGVAGGGIYGLAFIGALVFYIQNAETFWQGILGFVKALVWPTILIYKLLNY